MGVYVNESRRHYESVELDLSSGGIIDTTNINDPATSDRYVGDMAIGP
jgi:hypothetical protein